MSGLLPRLGRPRAGAAGGWGRRPPRAAGRGGSTPGSSRRSGPSWRRTRSANIRENSSAYARGPAVDRPWKVPVAHDLKFEITWRAAGRLASSPFASNLRWSSPSQALRPDAGPGHPSARTCAAPSTCPDANAPHDAPPQSGTTLRAQPPRLPELCSAAASIGCLVRAPPDPAPPDPVSRGQEEVVRLDLTRQHVKAFRSRHGAAQAPRHEGRRVLRDPPPRLASSHTWRGTSGAGAPRALPLPADRPPGSRQPPLAAPSPGYLVSRARGPPILPISP